MKIKRADVERMILMISPGTDPTTFPKKDLMLALEHEINHLLAQREHQTKAISAAMRIIVKVPDALEMMRAGLFDTTPPVQVVDNPTR